MWVYTDEFTFLFYICYYIVDRNFCSSTGCCRNGKEGREGMALGQYIAGMGFSNVGLGIAHSMAHTLGAVYDTPHGVFNSTAERFGDNLDCF